MIYRYLMRSAVHQTQTLKLFLLEFQIFRPLKTYPNISHLSAQFLSAEDVKMFVIYFYAVDDQDKVSLSFLTFEVHTHDADDDGLFIRHPHR